MDIIRTYRQVGSYRATAAICGTNPKTVRRVVARAKVGGSAAPRVRPVRHYESVTDSVAAKVEWRREHRRGHRPTIWNPGEYLVIDSQRVSRHRSR